MEYRLPRLNQVQVNHKINLSFSKVLRATLRQDPDILLIGEIRDTESAEIALRAAMTGHLVLSTLHTNDAVSSALRLIDMGIDPFLVASSLRTVVAQRLIRKLCPKCKQPAEAAPKYNYLIEEQHKGHTFYQPRGCVSCLNTGYKGRLGVFELLNIDDSLAAPLREGDVQKFTVLANQSSYVKLSEYAMEYALNGETSLEEVEKLSL